MIVFACVVTQGISLNVPLYFFARIQVPKRQQGAKMFSADFKLEAEQGFFYLCVLV